MAKPKPKPKTYSWVLSPDGMYCYVTTESYQTLTNLWETTELTAFHDAELAGATKEINAILGKLEKNNKDSKRKLSFIRFRNQHFLVWAKYGAVGLSDDDRTITKGLKLKI
jgi:hypothetical protein